jgi:hypothetical protein
MQLQIHPGSRRLDPRRIFQFLFNSMPNPGLHFSSLGYMLNLVGI